MFDELKATPEVLYGAAIAFAIVVLFTLAVGGWPGSSGPPTGLIRGASTAARSHGSGARDLPRNHRSRARVPRPLRRDARRPARRRGRNRRRRSRRLPRAFAADEARRAGRGRGDPAGVRRLDRPRHVPVPRRARHPGLTGVPLSILFIVAVMNMVNFLDGLDASPRACGIAGITYAILALSLVPDRDSPSAIVAGACLGFLRHNFFPRGSSAGDSGAMCLGFIPRSGLDPGAVQDRIDRRPPAAAAGARGADHRHVVQGREAAQVPL